MQFWIGDLKSDQTWSVHTDAGLQSSQKSTAGREILVDGEATQSRGSGERSIWKIKARARNGGFIPKGPLRRAQLLLGLFP